MAIKFNNRTIRLWKSGKKSESLGIGINFNKCKNKKEMNQIYKTVESILTLKYGKGEK